MNIPRNISSKMLYLFEELTPPIIRDSKWVMYFFVKILFKQHTDIAINFKDRAPYMGREEYDDAYEKTSRMPFDRESDVTSIAIQNILKSVKGKTVLDVGCGRSYLTNELNKKFTTTGLDVYIDPEIAKKYPKVRFVQGNIEALPFKDRSFDTVVCTQTLEHVLDFYQAVRQLRRVTKKRLIITVPKQRPYKYTFDLHVRFFPYLHSLMIMLRTEEKIHKSGKDLGADLFYYENRE